MTQSSDNLLPWLHYPVVMAGAFILFAVLKVQGASLIASTYIPVLLAAAAVNWLEFKFPHRTEWRPDTGEVKTDLAFMTVVQLAFPPPVGFVFAYALIEPARAFDRHSR